MKINRLLYERLQLHKWNIQVINNVQAYKLRQNSLGIVWHGANPSRVELQERCCIRGGIGVLNTRN